MENKNKYTNLNIFLTGYGAFLNHKENPTEKLVKKIVIEYKNTENCKILDFDIFDVEFNSINKNSSKFYKNILEKNKKDDLNIILHFGLNGSITEINLEKKCKNLIRDYKCLNGKICKDGPNFYKGGLNLKFICSKLKEKNHKVNISKDAGTYFCNYIYYRTCQTFANNDNILSLFIHIPLESCMAVVKVQNMFYDFVEILKEKYLDNK